MPHQPSHFHCLSYFSQSTVFTAQQWCSQAGGGGQSRPLTPKTADSDKIIVVSVVHTTSHFSFYEKCSVTWNMQKMHSRPRLHDTFQTPSRLGRRHPSPYSTPLGTCALTVGPDPTTHNFWLRHGRTTQLYYRDLGSRNSVRPSVCLSVCHTRALWQAKQCIADILIPHETAITLVF